MSNDTKTPEANIDLKAFAEEVANKTAARIAMQQAETKAKELADAEEKAIQLDVETAEKEAEQEKVKTIVEVGMSGAEQLMNDVEKRVSEKHEDLEKVVNELQSALKDKKRRNRSNS
jgi:Holliday junction resolvasome RuvABC DNA-binding subunit